MELIQRIEAYQREWDGSGISECGLSVFLKSQGLCDDLEFNSLQEGKIFFSVNPKRAWEYNVTGLQSPVCPGLEREREIYAALETVAADYDGMGVMLSSVGFKMEWQNDVSRRLRTYKAANYAGEVARAPGLKISPQAYAQAEKDAVTIVVAHIHPNYLVFDYEKSHDAGFCSDEQRDEFLEKLAQAAY